MQQWCRAAAFGGETMKSAGTVICFGNTWKSVELAGRTQGSRSQPRSAGQIHPDDESRSGGRIYNNEN